MRLVLVVYLAGCGEVAGRVGGELAAKAVTGMISNAYERAREEDRMAEAQVRQRQQQDEAVLATARSWTAMAAAAARIGDCQQVGLIEQQIAMLPAVVEEGMHAAVFIRDPDVRACLAMQSNFDAGAVAAGAHRYADAAVAFEAAYAARPEPRILHDIAVSYQRAGMCREAYRYFERFLVEATLEAGGRAAVRAEIDACVATP